MAVVLVVFGGVAAGAGSWDHRKPCTAERSEPGHLVVELDKLSGNEGLTLYATATATAAEVKAVTAAELPTAPTGKAVGTSLPQSLCNGGLFLAVALAGLALTLGTLRFLGRDQVVGEGGAGCGVSRPSGSPGRSPRPPRLPRA